MLWASHVTASLCTPSSAPSFTIQLFRLDSSMLLFHCLIPTWAMPRSIWKALLYFSTHVHERPATLRRSHGYSLPSRVAWDDSVFMRPSLESRNRPGRAESTLLKKLIVSRGTIGRVCCRTRSGASIGRRRRMGAPKITQPGAYTGNTQPRRPT
jgi:hypothetical protein